MPIAQSWHTKDTMCDICHKYVSIYHLPCLGKNSKDTCHEPVHLCIMCNTRSGLTHLLCRECCRDKKIDIICHSH